MGAAVVLWVVAGLAALAGAVLRGRRGWEARPVGGPLLGAGFLLGVTGLLFVAVVGDATLATADAPVLAAVLDVRSPVLTTVARTASLLGGTVWTGAAAVLAALVLALRGRRRRAAVWVVGVAVGAATIRLAKASVERPRPPAAARLAAETTSSLPSGHSLMAALGLGLVVVAVGTLAGRAGRVRVVAVAVPAVLVVLVVGASRVYLGVHWSTDVVAGWLVGAAIALLCLAAARALEAAPARRARRDPP